MENIVHCSIKLISSNKLLFTTIIFLSTIENVLKGNKINYLDLQTQFIVEIIFIFSDILIFNKKRNEKFLYRGVDGLSGIQSFDSLIISSKENYFKNMFSLFSKKKKKNKVHFDLILSRQLESD